MSNPLVTGFPVEIMIFFGGRGAHQCLMLAILFLGLLHSPLCLLSSPQLGFFLHLLLRNPLDWDGKHTLLPASDYPESS
jgi:hypothetical protein